MIYWNINTCTCYQSVFALNKLTDNVSSETMLYFLFWIKRQEVLKTTGLQLQVTNIYLKLKVSLNMVNVKEMGYGRSNERDGLRTEWNEMNMRNEVGNVTGRVLRGCSSDIVFSYYFRPSNVMEHVTSRVSGGELNTK